MTKEGYFAKIGILIAYHVLIFLTPFMWTASMSELFEFPKMLFVYAMTVIITTLWISRSIFDRTLYLTKTPFDIPIVIFFVSQLVATLFSIDIHTSIFGYYSRFHGGLLSTVSYTVLFYAMASNLDRTHVKNLVITLLTAATLTSLYSFPEHFGHSPSCALITGDFNASCWVQDVKTRVFGTFGQPNWQAAYLITVFFIPISLLITSLGRKNSLMLSVKNVSLALVIVLLFTVLLFTKSRSGLLGLGFGFAALTTGLLTRPAFRTISHFKVLGAIVAALVCLTYFFGKGIAPQIDRFLPRGTSSVPAKVAVTPPPPVTGTQLDIGGTESGDIRRIVWRGAYNLFLRHPAFGSGTETFAYAYYNVRPLEHNMVSEWDFLYNKAHNELLNYLSTTGIVGLTAYLMLLGWLVIWWLRDLSTGRVSPMYSLAFVSGIVALTVSNALGFSTVSVALLLFLYPGISVALSRKADKTQSNSNSDPLNWLGVSLVGIVGLYFLYRLGLMYTADTAYNRGKMELQAGSLPAAITELQSAAGKFPSEPVYTEQLSFAVAQAAAFVNQTGEATEAAKLASQAIAISDLNLSQNSVHLNFIKTRARLFIALTSIDPQFIHQAIDTLKYASTLAPTDPKLIYNLGLLYEQLEDYEKAEAYYLQSIDMKPNYDTARAALANLYEKLARYADAFSQYEYILNHIKPGDASLIEKVNRIATMSGQGFKPRHFYLLIFSPRRLYLDITSGVEHQIANFLHHSTPVIICNMLEIISVPDKKLREVSKPVNKV
jgi:putative inorganic carbon (hco3(-)) transporter